MNLINFSKLRKHSIVVSLTGLKKYFETGGTITSLMFLNAYIKFNNACTCS